MYEGKEFKYALFVVPNVIRCASRGSGTDLHFVKLIEEEIQLDP